MTNLDAFMLLVGKGSGVSEDDAALLLEFNDITPTGTWDPKNQTLRCGVYGAALGFMDQDEVGVTQVSEGGYSVSYDKGNKASYMDRLANESGCKELISKYRTRAVITSIANRW